MTEEQDKLLKRVYFSKTGFGSIANTLKDAKTKDPAITQKIVKEWLDKNVEKKNKQVSGVKNSFVAKEAFHEYECDIFYITDKQFKNQEYPFGLSVIDIFSKYACVIPMKERKYENIRDGLIKAFDFIGERPKVLFTDDEGA